MRDIEYTLVARDAATGQLIYEAAIEDINDLHNFEAELEPEIAQYVEFLEKEEDVMKRIPEDLFQVTRARANLLRGSDGWK